MSIQRTGRWTGMLLVVLTALLLAATAMSGYTRAEIVDSGAFAGRAAAALDDRHVRVVLAERMVDGLARNVAPDLLVVRPVAVAALAAVVDRPAFRRLFERTISSRHAVLRAGERRFEVALIPDDSLLVTLVRRVARRSGMALPVDLRLPVVALDPRDFELRVAGALSDLAGWWWPLLAATLASAAACAYVAGSVREALAGLGIAVAGAGLMVAALVAGLGAFVADHAASAIDLDDEDERQAVAALWSALFGDLRTAGMLAALGGTACAALVAGEPIARDLTAAAAWARRAATTSRPAAQVARAAGLFILGAALVLSPGPALRTVTVVTGAVLALIGLARLVDRRSAREPARLSPTGATPLRLVAAVLSVTAALGVGIASSLPSPAPAPAPAPAPGACNGSPSLCGKRLDQVVFPATHNSYAAADERGWYFANQRFGIARQLRDGIRAFLVDVHYGVPDRASGRIRTDLAYEGSSRNKVVRELSPQALRTADRLAGRVGVEELDGPRGVYFCHTLCELGAEPLDEQLGLFRSFLAENPGETLVLFVEPYVPPQEIERAFADAGLVDYAAAPALGEPLPTLGQLTKTGKRLVVLAEDDGGALPWYLDGFAFAQDTPLGATRPRELRCRRFRGRADSPLFQINHWIPPYPPAVSRNVRIGGTFLENRLARCERERGLVPNLVAVDFYERTDVIEIAARRNAASP